MVSESKQWWRTGAESVTAVCVSAVAGAVELKTCEWKAARRTVRGALVDRYTGSHLSDWVADVTIVRVGVRPAAQVTIWTTLDQPHCSMRTNSTQTSSPFEAWWCNSRVSDLRLGGCGFDFRSSYYRVVTICMDLGDCRWTDKQFRYITNTKINLAFNLSELDGPKSSALLFYSAVNLHALCGLECSCLGLRQVFPWCCCQHY